MPYARRIDRAHRACIMFLIDRSYSMNEPMAGDPGRTLKDGVADEINRTIWNLGMRCIVDSREGPRHYYDIGAIGYGLSAVADEQRVEPAFGGALAGRQLVSSVELLEHPLRVEERAMAGVHAGGATTREPVWFDALANYQTPMCEAIERAGEILADWVAEHQDSFPPIVLNITDGQANDQGSDGAGLTEWARRLRSLDTSDGNLLLFNLFLTSQRVQGNPFPSTPAGLPPEGRELFEITSELPPMMLSEARARDLPVAAGARGLFYNADKHGLEQFLAIGTMVRPTRD